MRGSLFPLFPLFPLFCWSMSIHPVKTWTTKIGEIREIGTLSWFWHFTQGKRCEGPYFTSFGGPCLDKMTRIGEIGTLSLVLALHPGKTLRGSLFHLFPLRVKCQNHERVPISSISSISPILVVHVYSSCQDMDRGNRGPLIGFGTSPRENVERAPISPILVAHVLTRWQDMDHQNRGNRGLLMVLALHP